MVRVSSSAERLNQIHHVFGSHSTAEDAIGSIIRAKVVGALLHPDVDAK